MCPRTGCIGRLQRANPGAFAENHYRLLYESRDLPPRLRAEEHTAQVALQRDLSQAIAEYAPGGKVVANKLEWESCGIRRCRYDDSRSFEQWTEGRADTPANVRKKYLIPRFGFVTPMFRDPKPPRRRAHRVYSTRPFFQGFAEADADIAQTRCGLRVSSAASVAYAVLLGAADAIGIPQNDLNVTIAAGSVPDASAMVLYDNVPGGAGLVTQLDEDDVLLRVLANARRRVTGGCGCDVSCYGCLRSYRNQFAHPHLDRRQALRALDRLEISVSAR